jgi:1-acyl-sn-glycerol-3-phosphate acyltransferase
VKNLARFRLRDEVTRGPAAAVAFKTAELALRALRDYHRHELVGFENIPRTGPALIACNHSFATYDGWLMGIALKDRRSRDDALSARQILPGGRLRGGLA